MDLDESYRDDALHPNPVNSACENCVRQNLLNKILYDGLAGERRHQKLHTCYVSMTMMLTGNLNSRLKPIKGTLGTDTASVCDPLQYIS